MSDYRVFDKNKNLYDATVMSSLFVDDVPKGFNISANSIGEDDSHYLNGEIILTTFRQNPTGGIYYCNINSSTDNDFSIICIPENSTVYSRMFYYYDNPLSDSPLTFIVTIKNETDFNVRIYNFDVTDYFPNEGEINVGSWTGQVGIVKISYEQGYSPDDISSINEEIPPHSQKGIPFIKMNRQVITDVVGGRDMEWKLSLWSFYLQRIF